MRIGMTAKKPRKRIEPKTDAEGYHRDDDPVRGDLLVIISGNESGHLRGGHSQLEAYERDDRAHGRGRKHHLDPAGAEDADDQCDEDEHAAGRDEAAERVRIVLMLERGVGAENDEHGRDEREARAEKRRSPSLAQKQIDERADAVHEKNDRGVDAEKRGDENRRAEHGEKVLEAQGKAFRKADFLVDLDNWARHENSLDWVIMIPIRVF